nr:transposon TX1 [Tanacetum cinerariifolium]
MAQKQLRNGKRYGFVRFKFIRDVERLLVQLQKIKIEDEWLRVYVAYDRRSKVNGESDKGGMVKEDAMNTRNKINATYNDGWYRFVWNGGRNRDRSFIDVLNGVNKNAATTNICTNTNMRRTIEITQSDTNREILARSAVGEVKARCFLLKLWAFCTEQGLEKAEERTEEEVKKGEDNDILIDEEEDDEDLNSDEGASSNEDEEGECKEERGGCHEPAIIFDDWRGEEEDKELVLSRETKVGRTFKGDTTIYKDQAAVCSANVANGGDFDKNSDINVGDNNYVGDTQVSIFQHVTFWRECQQQIWEMGLGTHLVC